MRLLTRLNASSGLADEKYYHRNKFVYFATHTLQKCAGGEREMAYIKRPADLSIVKRLGRFYIVQKYIIVFT